MTYDSMTYPLSQQNVEELRAMRGGRTKVPSLEQISDRLNAAAMCVQGPPASPWHASRRTSPCSSSRLSKRTCAALLKLTPACEDLEDGDEAPQEGVEVSPRNLRDRNLCKGRRPSEYSGLRGAHRLVSGPHRAAASVLLEDARRVSLSRALPLSSLGTRLPFSGSNMKVPPKKLCAIKAKTQRIKKSLSAHAL